MYSSKWNQRRNLASYEHNHMAMRIGTSPWSSIVRKTMPTAIYKLETVHALTHAHTRVHCSSAHARYAARRTAALAMIINLIWTVKERACWSIASFSFQKHAWVFLKWRGEDTWLKYVIFRYGAGVVIVILMNEIVLVDGALVFLLSDAF